MWTTANHEYGAESNRGRLQGMGKLETVAIKRMGGSTKIEVSYEVVTLANMLPLQGAMWTLMKEECVEGSGRVARRDYE